MADITYRFVSSGHKDVEAAFQSIEGAARKSTAAVEKLFSSIKSVGGAGRRFGGGDGVGAGIGGGGWGGGGGRGGGGTRLETLAQQVAKDQERAAKRAAASRASALDYVARIRDRHFADEQRGRERAAQHAMRVDARIAKARKDILVSGLRDHYRQQDATASAEKRHQERLVSIQKSSADRLRQIKQSAADKRDDQASSFKQRLATERAEAFGRIPGQLKGLALGGAVAGGTLAAGVGGAAIKDAFALQAIANRISINSRKHGEEFIDPTTLRKEFEATSLATNGVISAQEVAAGQQKFISKTGNIAQSRAFATTFAKTAAATDTSYEAVASAGAELAQKFKIETAKEMQDALASITFGGKEGAFELTDAAAKYAKLASAGATFGLDKGVGGVRTLQGLSQIAMSSTGDRDTATSAVEAMFRQIVTNSGDIKGLGVDVFTDASHTKTRSIEQLLPEILAASGGDKVKLQKIFGDEGKRAINPLIDTFTSAYGSATGKNGRQATAAERAAAGKAAVNAQLQSSINAPGTFADIEKDAAQAAANPAAKFSAVWERLTAAMADKMVPALERMIDKIEVSQGAIDMFVGTFEALLDMIQAAGEAFGLIKNPRDNPEYQKKKELQRAKSLERDLAALPTQEKVDALVQAGKPQEAIAMAEQLNNYATGKRRRELELELDISRGRVAKFEGIGNAVDKARTLGAGAKGKDAFADLYQSLGSGGDTGTTAWQAKMRAEMITASPGAKIDANSDEFLPGENADQRNARLGYRDNALAARTQVGGKTDDAGAEMASKGLAASLSKLITATDLATKSMAVAAAAAQPNISHQ